MKTKLAVSLIALVLLSACAGAPTWDTSVFPNQAVYSGAAASDKLVEVPVRQ